MVDKLFLLAVLLFSKFGATAHVQLILFCYRKIFILLIFFMIYYRQSFKIGVLD